MDSITAEVLSATSTGPSETSSPQGGPTPSDASSQAPSGSGPVLKANRPGPVTGTAPDDSEASNGLKPGFN